MKFRFPLIAILLLTFALVAGAQQKYLLSPMPGYTEKVTKDLEFGVADSITHFDCGVVNDRPVKCTQNDPGFDEHGNLVAEGKVTSLEYQAIDKDGAGWFAVFRNYDNAIKKAGGRELTASNSSPINTLTHVYLIDRPQRKMWIVLSRITPAIYTLQYIESKPMQQGVTVNEQVLKANDLEDAIAKSGFATLYINFDTNKFDLPADAAPTVAEVVKLLKKQSGWRLSVEGHTDNVGSAAANKTLSQNRAASVMKAIVAGGINASRLSAKGYGSEAPIADNRTEDGRAKNRRVELVKAK